MSGFGEHIDRLLFVQRLSYHELVALLLDMPDETFAELFPDYHQWRTERVQVRLRETGGLVSPATLPMTPQAMAVPARPRARRALRRTRR